MTSPDQVSAVFHTIFGLVCVWVLLYFGFRDFRIDFLRHKLFLIRDQLFDCAARGEVPFDHDAYRLFRETLNGMIRFAHRATMLRLLITMFEIKEYPALEAEITYPKWLNAVKTLPDDVGRKLVDLHYEMIRAFVKHIVYGSPTLPIFALFWVTNKIRFAVRPAKRESLTEQFREPLLEAQALEEHQRDFRSEDESDTVVALPV